MSINKTGIAVSSKSSAIKVALKLSVYYEEPIEGIFTMTTKSRVVIISTQKRTYDRRLAYLVATPIVRPRRPVVLVC